MPHCLITPLLILSLSQSPQAVRPSGNGLIIGHVVDPANDQRIGGATVTIAGGGLPAPEKAVTDADGQFVFRAMPGGTFTIDVRRGGYLDGALGRRRPGGPARTLKLDSDERRDDITIALFKSAAITGTIADDAGEPVVKVEVKAYRRAFLSGRPVLTEANSDVTDDRGVYRIGRLEPGDYVVAVPMVADARTGSDPTDMGSDPMRREVRDGGSSATHLPPLDGKIQKFPATYYATGQTAAEATVITLGLGDLRRDVDVQLRPQKAVNVSGAVTVAKGAAKSVEVSLTAAGEDDIAGDRTTATTLTSESGTYSFAAIPAGQYWLRAFVRPARANDPDGPQWAEQLIALNDKDLLDVALFLRLGLRVSGRFEFDGASDDTDPWTRGLSVTLDPASSRYADLPAPVATVDAGGRNFSLTNVLPGKYLVRATASGGRAVKSVMYQGRDVSQAPVTIDAADLAGLVVTLTDQPTILSGTVSGTGDPAEASVLLFPQDPQRWLDFGASSATLRMIDVTTTGTFDLRGLPAGDYLLVALDQDTIADWQNPAFLRTAVPLATHVRLGDGEQRSVDLKIVSIR